MINGIYSHIRIGRVIIDQVEYGRPLAGHLQADAVAGVEGVRCGPELDLEFIDFSRAEFLFLLVGMPRLVGLAFLLVDLPVRGLKPPAGEQAATAPRVLVE
jgi:hypothetical protein